MPAPGPASASDAPPALELRPRVPGAHARLRAALAGRYVGACLAPAVAFALQVALSGYLYPPFILFFPAVMLVAMFGGFGPGLVATAVSALLAARWILPADGDDPRVAARRAVALASFAGVGVLTSAVSHLYQRARERLAAQERALAEREAEDQLRASRAQLEAVFQAMSDGVVVFDMAGNVVLLNEAAARISEFPSTHSMREGLARITEVYEVWDLDGTQLPVQQWPIARVIRGESVVDLGLRVRRRDIGREWYFSVSGEPVRDAHGEQILAVVINRDITDRKNAERALREQLALEDQLAKVAASVPGLIFSYRLRPDGGACFPFTTPVVQEMLGVSQEALAKDVAPFFSGVHPADARGVGEVIAESARALSRCHGEFRYLHPTKGLRWIEAWSVPKAEPGGGVLWHGFAMDATERKRAEVALREADRRKGEFLGVLSHELRNPLAPIRNSIHVLDRVPADSPQAASAKEVIQRQTAHLARIVDDLLDVTRIGRGKIELDPKRIDLREVVLRTSEDHRSLFGQRDLELRHGLPASAVWIDADDTRISQVLGNLLQNAAKFTPAGGAVTVEVGVRDGHAELSVRDTGVGMRAEDVERMFEPFVQADRTLARTGGGLGLGLAMVKGLVELHGGSVRARSAGPGRGSEFCVLLPVSQPQVRGDPPVVPTAPAPAGTVDGRLVLIIEDNLDASQSLSVVLELIGHRVHTARDGSTGIASAHELRPDVVLCDIGLPDMDGYEVARRLRADEALHSTRLYALSGYAQPEDKRRAKEAGFDAHLPKPPPLDELNRLLARGL